MTALKCRVQLRFKPRLHSTENKKTEKLRKDFRLKEGHTLLRLRIFVGMFDSIAFAVLYKIRTRLMKIELYVIFVAIGFDLLDPIEITRTGVGVRFAADGHRAELTLRQIRLQIDVFQYGRYEYILSFCGKLDKYRQTRVRRLLIFAGYRYRYVAVAAAPIRRQTFARPFDTFSTYQKIYVGAAFDYFPRFAAPLVGFRNEKVRSKASRQLRARRHLEIARLVPCKRQIEICLGAGNDVCVPVAGTVQKIYVAVKTARTALVTAVPRVPHYRFHISQIRLKGLNHLDVTTLGALCPNTT